MNFGEKLKTLREYKKITQKELALKLGVTQRTISYYENNITKPNNIDFITNLAMALGVSLDELIDSEDDKADSKIHKLIEKLIKDTLIKNIIWLDIKHSYRYEPYYDDFNGESSDGTLFIEYFKADDFSILNNTKIDFNHSFICKYKEGSYLLLKFTGKDEQNEDSIKFALFVFSPKTEMYHYIINNKTLEKLEDLYLAIINVDSDVDSYIDDYLKDNFSTTYTEEIPF